MLGKTDIPPKKVNNNMLVPIRALSLLLLLILTVQILPNTSSYQGGKVATKRCNSTPKRVALANTGGEQAAVIRGNKQKGPQMAYTEKVMKEENNIAAAKQEKMVGLNVKGEQIMSRRPLSQPGGKDSAEYVAFTADYKSPRHHPPRHN